jgi:tetratricopeptide (TPR) repeat protein
VARAHQEWLRLGAADRAARCGFWLAFRLLLRGEVARGGGWVARARRLLDDGDLDDVEPGYLLVPEAIQRLAGGDVAAAYATFSQAAKIGDRFRDPDLRTLAELGRGQALTRLGEIAEAEEAYREASEWGHPPQPGLALLRLAQGRVDAAAAAIRTALDEAQDRIARASVLVAYVEIVLMADDVPAARAAADGLSEIGADLGMPFLHAVSAHATGAVLLAEGDTRAALATLRRAWTAWQELQAPYEATRARVLMGLAYQALGDADTAEMEPDAARQVFQQLGAAPEITRVEALGGWQRPGRRAG